MKLTLNADRQALVERAQSLAGEVVRPASLEHHRRGTFPLEILRQLADHGLMGVNISPDLGGSGAGVIAYSLAVTAIAEADPAVAVTMAVNNMVGEVLEAFASPSLQEALIPPLTSGDASSGAFCLSEPGSGSDAAGMRTRATREGSGWSLSGTKAWITSGAHAHVYLVWAKTDDTISLFAVDPQSPGIKIGAPEEKLGQHASNTVALSFDGVDVSNDALVGEVGDGFPIAMMALDGGRIGIASQSLGIANAAWDLAQRHLDAPERQRLSGLWADVASARAITLRAAWLKEQGDQGFTRQASMAKMLASEAAQSLIEAVYARLPLPSGHPDMARAAKLLEDVRVTRIYEGTNEIQRLVIARDLIRRGL